MAATVQRKLAEGYRCLYLNSRPMVAGIRSCLAALGTDVTHEIAQGRLVLSSEPVTLGNGVFDVDAMLRTLEQALDKALAEGFKGLWATGDMSWEFGGEKNLEKLLEYEYGLEALFQKRPELAGICQYHQDTLPREATRQGLSAHQAIFLNETLTRINPHYVAATVANLRATSHSVLDRMVKELCQLQHAKS
jgi:hypothetical protein